MYKYTNSSNSVVTDGNGFSALITNPAIQAWLADGNTPAPADAPAPPSVAQQLDALDAANMLTQRNLREFILLTTEAIKVATNNAVDLSQLPGVANVANVEALAAELRSQL